MANVYSVPQAFSTTLNVGGGINNSQTTGIVLTSVTGLPTDGGFLCFDWAQTLDTAVAEWIEYTGISGNELTGVTRGAEGYSAKSHSNGAVVAGIISQGHIKRLKEKLDGTDTTGAAIKQITDTSGNEQVIFVKTTSAVNEVSVTNAATGNGPTISATGGDTNVDLNLQPKGTGVTNIKATATSAAEIRLFEDTDNGTNYLGFKPPAAVTASKTFTLPDGDGTSGQALVTNGSSVLSWASAGGGKILQVVSATYSTAADNTTGSLEDTGLTASITPSSTSSRVLVYFHQGDCYSSANTVYQEVVLKRGSTTIYTPHLYAGGISTGGSGGRYTCSGMYVDSPSTTSAITYKTQHRISTGTGTVYVQGDNSTATIILAEIGP